MNSNRKFNAIVRMMIGGVSLAALALSSAFAQAVRNDGAGSGPAAPPPPVVTTTPSLSDEVIMLSPFQVDATREKGYFAENTLAGSRMRTNIADLGAAISVVTKQQMEDTASLDVNDIFRYELGTEGSSTYTPVANSYSSSRKDGLSDNIAGSNSGGGMNAATNATANRIRGLGAPSMALNYYMALDQVPFDSYNTASIEINRGPNSMLFGMGSPAGIVNQSTAQALINKNTGSVQVRVDDRGSERASFSFNKSLIDNKLAIYGAFLYNDQQFERKPSYDITRRQYGAITYKPFKRTTLRASIEGYNNDNRRPNSLTPVDGVTEWRNSGKPVYNALTHEFISLATGQVVSKLASSQYSQNAADVIAYVASQPDFDDTKWDAAKNQYNGISIFGTGAITNINSILYVPGINFHSARTVMQIADGALQRWFQPLSGQRPLISRNPDTYPFVTSGNPADDPNHVYSNPTWANIYDWFQTESAATGMDANPPYAGNKFYPAVTDKSVYDWERVNILSMNFGRQRSTNYNIELEQEILPNLLHFSAGWLRQDFDSMQSYTVSQLNSARLYVDTNILNSDGTPNPYFGRPFVYDQEPDRMEDSQTIDQYRAMLAFTPDFTKNNNWTKWLGRHQFLGLASYMDHERTTFRRRLAYVGGSAETIARYMNNPASATFHMQNNGSRRYFYLSNGGEAVNKASGAYDAGPVVSSITVYDFAQNKFKEIETIMDWIIRSEGTGKSERLLTSYSAGWTGYLWDDRIITTVGVRRDINRTRNTGSPGNSDFGNPKWWTDGVYQYEKAFNDFMSDWSRLSGDTHTYGVVVKPFLHWDSIARRASDNLWWEFVENLGFSYNTSDNFNAPSGTNVDLFGNVLPKPQGEGKDWGVQFSLFKNKLYARVNWFESSNENTPSAGGLQRLHWHMDTTAFRGWLEHIYMLNDGGNPLETDWTNPWTVNATGADPAKIAAMQTWVAEKWGLVNPKTGQYDYNYYNNLGGTINGTMSTDAKGVEATVQYNPLPNWTVKVTATKISTANANTNKEFDAWYAVRRPMWENAKAADYLIPSKQQYADPGGYSIDPTDPGTTDPNKRAVITNFMTSTNFRNANAATTITPSNSDGWTTVQGYYDAVVEPGYALERDLQGQQVMGQRKYSFNFLTNYNFDRGSLKGWSVGGAQRWASKSIIGYYGKVSGITAGSTLMDAADTTRPVYDDPVWYTDLWVAYTHKIFNDKVRMKLQLNVADVFQDGELRPVAVHYDGKPYAYRIVDSRQFILTATFDF